MPSSFQPYSDPKNLLAIRTLGLNIVSDVAPDEELSAQKLTNRIVKAWDDGQLIVAGSNATTAGGFGNIDLVLLVIIPVVIAVFRELDKQWLTGELDTLKKRIQENEANKSAAIKIIDETVEREYRSVNEKVKSKRARSKEKVAKQAIKEQIKKLMVRRMLKIFICHSLPDQPKADGLYDILKNDSYSPWLDDKEILPGQDWELETEKAIKSADVALILLSMQSINQRSYMQKEIKMFIEIAMEQPQGKIYTIPIRLDNCVIPDGLRKWKPVDFITPNQNLAPDENQLRQLKKALDLCAHDKNL